tara:strand:- start:875 stop:1513 length:639 start_codon:yes stop_codon:yes gene_type:complete
MKVNLIKHIAKYKDQFLLIFILLTLISCTVMNDMSSKNKVINTLERISLNYYKIDKLLLVNVEDQEMYLLQKGIIINKYLISSSVYGTGSKVNSLKTPLGRHIIVQKIGDGLPLAAVLKGREWTGGIANIITDPIDTEFDIVTSRILWLSGLEEGLNSGPGVDSKSRYIYIHGTAEEGLIGKPASDGCIRMYNKDVISLFNKVDTKTEVWIH